MTFGYVGLAAFSMALLAAAPDASAITVDFTGAGVGNGSPVSQSYGDSASADLSYQTLNGGNNWGQNAVQAQNGGTVSYWTGGYSGDQAIYANSNGQKLELQLDAGPGLVFTSITFNLGGYSDANRLIDFKIFDANWTELLSGASFFISGTTGGAITLSLLNTSSIVFQMGDDWNAGLTGVTFDVAQVSAVPVPGALILLGSGLLGFAGFGARYGRAKSRG
jgi:hypothetical protein